MTAATDRLAEVRAKLTEAEAALAALPVSIPAAKRRAAEEHKAATEKALVQAKAAVENEAKAAEHKADAKPKLETRPAEAPAEVHHEVKHEVKHKVKHGPDVLQALIQAGTTQTVRGTDHLTPKQQADRRNPQHS
jgi:hypothetical protein